MTKLTKYLSGKNVKQINFHHGISRMQKKNLLPNVLDVGCNVVFCPWIKIGFRSDHWRSDTLVFLTENYIILLMSLKHYFSLYGPQFPPVTVVVLGRYRSIEHIPSPFVHDVSKWEEGDFIQSRYQQIVNSCLVVYSYSLVQQTDFLET